MTQHPVSRTRPKADARSAPPAWLALVIVAVGVWAYANSFAGVFVLDDVRAIVRNPTIRGEAPLSSALAPPTGTTVAGRPLANLSLALNYALAPPQAREVFEPSRGGRDDARTALFLANARGYHALNLGIHLCVALVLFGVVRRTMLTDVLRPGFGAASSWLALAAATIWVAHPLTTAAVSYVVQRVESLMALFYLLTLYAAIRASDGPRQGLWSSVAVASCACGMATKEVMVTAPLAVALWDAVFRRGWLVRARLPFLAALAATWIIPAVLVAGEQRGPSIDLSGDVVWRYLLTQTGVLLHYLSLAVVPAPLVFLYDWPLVPSFGAALPQFVSIVLLVAAVVILTVRRNPFGYAGAVFFLILAPSSSVLPIVTEVAAEHRMYLPLAAVVTVFVAVLFWLGRRAPVPVRWTATAGAVACVALVAWCGIGTRARNLDYTSETQLWRTSVEARPADARARVAYGSALAADGLVAEAEAELGQAVQLAPADPVALVRLGAVLARQNKMDAAIARFQQALALRPDDVDANRFLADAYAMRRDDAHALPHYERALHLASGDPDLSLRLAALLADSRDPAVRDATRAITLVEQAMGAMGRRDLRALEVLSVALGSAFRWTEAAATAREAAALARARGDARRAGAFDYRAGAYEQAARQGLVPRR